MMKLIRTFCSKSVYRGGKFGRIIPGGGPLGGTTIPGTIGGLGGIPCGAIWTDAGPPIPINHKTLSRLSKIST